MNNETKQTAVEKFIEKLRELGYLGIDYSPELLKAIEQAKEMEKERLAETWIAALEYGITNLKSFNNLTSEEAFEYGITNLKDFNNLTSEEEFEQYYENTYGGNK